MLQCVCYRRFSYSVKVKCFEVIINTSDLVLLYGKQLLKFVCELYFKYLKWGFIQIQFPVRTKSNKREFSFSN